MDRVVIPGGCTKYTQAPDVSWNKPFKSSRTEKYDHWLGSVGIQEETASGNLKALLRRAILQWILDSWAELPEMSLRNLSKVAPRIFQWMGRKTTQFIASREDSLAAPDEQYFSHI